jgi:hypothetical protein
MTDHELAALAIIIVGILCIFTLAAYTVPDRFRDALNVLKVILLALIGKRASDRQPDAKNKPPDQPRK